MSEELLHGCKPGSVVKHVCGKRMAQHMRAKTRCMGCAAERSVNHIVHQLSVKRLACDPEKKLRCAHRYEFIAHLPVSVYHLCQFCSERYYSFLITLAEHF